MIECRKSKVQCYECQVVKNVFGKNIAFDACLAKELFFLWDKGIVTTGSCCGQHIDCDVNMNAYISVYDNYRQQMLDLGYCEFKKCHFYAKTNFKNRCLDKRYTRKY